VLLRAASRKTLGSGELFNCFPSSKIEVLNLLTSISKDGLHYVLVTRILHYDFDQLLILENSCI
jgi:hypothetical protein